MPVEGARWGSTAADVGIPSTWRQAAAARRHDAPAQTTTPAAAASVAAVQHPDRSDDGAQTASQPAAAAAAASFVADDAELLRFLKRAQRLLDDEPAGGESFSAFVTATRTGADDGGQHARLAYCLHGPPGLPVSRLDWNCSGHVLAVAHGRPDHAGWCRHTGRGVSLWNLARKISADCPDRGLDLDACATSLAFHPSRPNLLAVGMFAGQIVVVDVAADHGADPITARSPIDDLTHREPVTSLEWVRDAVGHDHLLASIAADGRVLLWAPLAAGGLARPIAGIRLAPGPVYQGRGLLPNRHGVLGGRAVALSPSLDGLVVAGTEAGALLRCQLVTPTQYHGRGDVRTSSGMIWAAGAAALVRHSDGLRRHVERAALLRGLRRIEAADIWAAQPPPSDLYPEAAALLYHGHTGPVHAIAFSRHHRHLFLTCAADGDFRVYHVLRTAPILSLNVTGTALIDARWSFCRPAVAVVVDARGVVHVVDLLKDVHAPVLSLSMNETGSAAVSLAFNRGDGTFLACGDLDGNVALWSLSETLYQLQPNEIAFLDQWDVIADEGHSCVVVARSQ